MKSLPIQSSTLECALELVYLQVHKTSRDASASSYDCSPQTDEINEDMIGCSHFNHHQKLKHCLHCS